MTDGTQEPAFNNRSPFFNNGSFFQSPLQQSNVQFVLKANKLLLDTTRAMWEGEAELVHLGIDQTIKACAPLKTGEDPGATLCGYYDRCHECSDRVVDQMRRLSDVARNFGWDFLELYVESFQHAPNGGAKL